MADIFDTILFEGTYSETISVKKKLTFTLRSRTVEEVMAINDLVENKEFKTQGAALDEQLFRHLSYALVNYNGVSWEHLTAEQRADKIKKFPAPIMQLLTSKLGEFDKKVSDACKEGEENFSPTPGQEAG